MSNSRPILDAREQAAMALLNEFMSIVQSEWGMTANAAELVSAVHVLQGFVIQHMLHRLEPEHWSGWSEAAHEPERPPGQVVALANHVDAAARNRWLDTLERHSEAFVELVMSIAEWAEGREWFKVAEVVSGLGLSQCQAYKALRLGPFVHRYGLGYRLAQGIRVPKPRPPVCEPEPEVDDSDQDEAALDAWRRRHERAGPVVRQRVEGIAEWARSLDRFSRDDVVRQFDLSDWAAYDAISRGPFVPVPGGRYRLAKDYQPCPEPDPPQYERFVDMPRADKVRVLLEHVHANGPQKIRDLAEHFDVTYQTAYTISKLAGLVDCGLSKYGTAEQFAERERLHAERLDEEEGEPEPGPPREFRDLRRAEKAVVIADYVAEHGPQRVKDLAAHFGVSVPATHVAVQLSGLVSIEHGLWGTEQQKAEYRSPSPGGVPAESPRADDPPEFKDLDDLLGQPMPSHVPLSEKERLMDQALAKVAERRRIRAMTTAESDKNTTIKLDLNDEDRRDYERVRREMLARISKGGDVSLMEGDDEDADDDYRAIAAR